MVIDDDPDDMELTRIALAKIGCGTKCMMATRGETALEFLRSLKELPSLILLDLKMPGMSGIDTICRIRTNNDLKHIPVAIVTNSTLESDRIAALAAGANAFIHKDFNLNKYAKNLQGQLEQWGMK